MARVLLGATGSVAAIKVPELYLALRGAGHTVRIVATEPALYFFQPADLVFDPPDADQILFRDADEWPAEGWSRGDLVVHIALREWADILMLAPLDANTLAKMALGLADNCLTCVLRAWDFARPMVLAPAMNTRMWQSPITRRHLAQILADHGDGRHRDDWTLEEAPEVFARHAPNVVLVPPQAKRLACGDFGVGAMADVPAIAEVVRRWGVETSVGQPPPA